MSVRPFELHEIELKNGEFRQAIKNPDMASHWRDGWSVAYCWITTKQDVVAGVPKGLARSFLMVVMAPPRPMDAAEAVPVELVQSAPQPQPASAVQVAVSVVLVMLSLAAMVAATVWLAQ